MCPELSWLSEWTRRTVASLTVRFIRPTWSLVHGEVVSLCSVPFASQIISERIGRDQMVFRFRDGSAHRMRLSVSTAWIWQGTTSSIG